MKNGDWKICTIEEDGPWELYDLSVDRGETHNLAMENPEKLQELVSLWEAQRIEIIDQIGAANTSGAEDTAHFDPL